MVLDEMMVPIIGVEPTTFALRISRITFNLLFYMNITAFTLRNLMSHDVRKWMAIYHV